MPFTIDWLIPYRAIGIVAKDTIRIEDFDYYQEGLVRLLTEAQSHAPGLLVYNVFDSTEVESYPPIYLMFTRALPVLRFQNRGPMFVITPKRTTRSIFELTSHIMAFSLRTFNTPEDARTALDFALAKEKNQLSNNI